MKDKLKVMEVQLQHELHNSDKQTYNHYPENMRLDKEQQQEVEKLVALGTNKQRIKADLMKSGKEVPIKLLHNIQTT